MVFVTLTAFAKSASAMYHLGGRMVRAGMAARVENLWAAPTYVLLPMVPGRKRIARVLCFLARHLPAPCTRDWVQGPYFSSTPSREASSSVEIPRGPLPPTLRLLYIAKEAQRGLSMGENHPSDSSYTNERRTPMTSSHSHSMCNDSNRCCTWTPLNQGDCELTSPKL